MQYNAFMRAVSFIAAFFLVSAATVSLSVLSARMFMSGAEEAFINADKRVIIIDSGHGGADSGAVSDDGIKEKDLNLAVGKTLCALFRAEGFNVIMTRETDEMLSSGSTGKKKLDDLKCRVAETERYGGDAIFISIHMNKYPLVKCKGLQVFYSGNENSSHLLADCIQNTVKRLMQPENNRETKLAGSEIYVLDNTMCTAVLVECGFLSNPDECGKLQTDEYRHSLAVCIFFATLEFLKNNEGSIN